jgi:hypothetical protein
MVQWTDNPTNPSICTSIRNGDEWYPCLPSDFKVETSDFARVSGIYPSVPLRASDSELSIPFPQGFFPDEAGDPTPAQIGSEASTRREEQGDTTRVIKSWRITSTPNLPCEDADQTASAAFEYASTEGGEPISELITLTCGAESEPFFGVVYHDIEFVDRSELASDFFDVDATRTGILEDQLSSAAAQLGSVFWFGEEAGDWNLEGASHDAGSASVYYSRAGDDGAEFVELITRVGNVGRGCDDPEPLPNNEYQGSVCPRKEESQGYTAAFWRPAGFEVWMEADSWESNISQDDARALAVRLDEWEQKADGPLLTEDAVRNLVADSLDLVCPSKRLAIRDAHSSASFEFNRELGEWSGAFGSFGEIAVPDSKPVAIQVTNREEVENTLGHNAAQFADCVADEQPPPQEGDDEFGVTFISTDDSGFTFEITGVDSEAEAALSFCMFDDERCTLTDPDGTRFGARGAEINDVRPDVLRIHLSLGEDELSRTGQWRFALDLGDGRTAETTFELP